MALIDSLKVTTLGLGGEKPALRAAHQQILLKYMLMDKLNQQHTQL